MKPFPKPPGEKGENPFAKFIKKKGDGAEKSPLAKKFKKAAKKVKKGKCPECGMDYSKCKCE